MLISLGDRQARCREDPEMPQQSELTVLPKKVPIDWFDPIYWNSLTVHERAEYSQGGTPVVALPLEQFCETWELCNQWKNLPREVFMEKYGNAVLSQYNLPTPEELAQLEEWDEEEEVEDDLEDGDDD